LEAFTIIINDAPYGVERPWNALRLALTFLSVAIMRARPKESIR